MQVKSLEAKLGYSFKEVQLLQSALTHPSYDLSLIAKQARNTYQRLEFLGDAVLNLAIADFIYRSFPQHSEGQLATIRTNSVRTKAIVHVAQQLELAAHLLTGSQRDRTIESNLENSLEAVLGAIYMDGGFAAASSIIQQLWQRHIFDNAHYSVMTKSFKSQLQEYVQERGWNIPRYQMVSRSGTAHEPTFVIEVTVQADSLLHRATMSGKNKKEAAEQVASKMLTMLKETAGERL